MNLIVTPEAVREYLTLNASGASSRYSADTVHSNIVAAQSFLERTTHRFLYDHPGVTWSTTTMLQAQVAIPGFRTFDSCTWGGSTIVVGTPGNDTNAGAWAIPEPQEGVPDGGLVYVALQFRAWRVDPASGVPWWYADSQWWDKALDNPFYPGNWGGGYAWTSMPNDLVITGDGGYAPGAEPEQLKHVVKVLAAWYTMRPASVMGDMAAAPGGGTISYAYLPPEVESFVATWKSGTQAQSVG